MKKLTIFTICYGIAFGVITVTGSLLFAFNVLSFGANALGAVFVAVDFLMAVSFAVLCYVASKMKKSAAMAELKKTIEQDRQMQLLSLYKRFGIPLQRDKDGNLLNFYELLGIEPQYDEFGERVPTIYELLNIFPHFDGNGNEVPIVLFIKNRATKFAVNVPPYLNRLQITNEHLSEIEKIKSNKKKDQIAKNISSDEKKAKKSSSKSSGSSKSVKFFAMNTYASSSKSKNYSVEVFFSGGGKSKSAKNSKPAPVNQQDNKEKNLNTVKINEQSSNSNINDVPVEAHSSEFPSNKEKNKDETDKLKSNMFSVGQDFSVSLDFERESDDEREILSDALDQNIRIEKEV